MARTAGNSSERLFFVQSPVAETIIMGRGAIMAAISTLKVSRRRLGAFSHSPPPCMMAEIMFTGAENCMRSSTASRRSVCVAPPDAPVAPMRAALTSGSDSRKSTARMEFHNCRESDPKSQSCSTGQRAFAFIGLMRSDGHRCHHRHYVQEQHNIAKKRIGQRLACDDFEPYPAGLVETPRGHAERHHAPEQSRMTDAVPRIFGRDNKGGADYQQGDDVAHDHSKKRGWE